jgi:transcriptional regulator with PAS, ATPase and Fis domain
MSQLGWTRQFPAAITVCSSEGILIEMNDRAAQVFEKDGGRALLGQNMLNCHPEPARARAEHLLATHERNVYTIEKSGVKKLIYQCPWYEDGQYAGFVELALEIPFEIPHFVRT